MPLRESAMMHAVAYIGRQAIAVLGHLLKLAAFNYRVFAQFTQRCKDGRQLIWKTAVEQIYFTGVQILPILVPIGLITGSFIFVQFLILSGQYDLSKTSIFLLVRELGPLITALLVILRSATAITIEISCMNVFNEIKAIELQGIPAYRLICLPRVIGVTTAMLGLFFIFDVVAIIGGHAILWVITDMPVTTFLTQIGKAISPADICVGIVKAILFGVVITITCLYHGLQSSNTITTVPIATSKASMECFFYCVIINFSVSLSFYA
jgi:phospholipid/cholesterol/gamma-HCH transport system permease protein